MAALQQQQQPQEERQQRLFVNMFLILFIPLLILDTLPFHPICVDWIVQPLGLWQGSWKLFAPHIDTANVQLAAVMDISSSNDENNATRLSWKSPDWSNNSRTVSEKMRSFRWMQYYAKIGRYPALYLPLAEWTLLQQEEEQIKITSLRLYQWTEYPLHAAPPPSSPSSLTIAWTPPARKWLRTFVNE